MKKLSIILLLLFIPLIVFGERVMRWPTKTRVDVYSSVEANALYVPYLNATSDLDMGAYNITSAIGTFGDITIFDATPILVFQDSNSAGAASVGFIEWRDSGGGRAGFFGNSSSDNDDLLWKNEQGGNIGIQTTGGGNLDIIATLAQFNATPITTLGTGRFDGGLTDSTPVVVIDLVNRQLENSSGTVVGDWENSILYDNSNVESINFNSRILTDENNAYSIDFTSNRFLADSSGNGGLNWANRQLIANDGSDVILDWATAGTAGFGDSAITTTGSGGFLDITFSDANHSPDAPGELLYDNTVAGFTDGLFTWYDDDAIRYLVDLDTLPGDAEDDKVVSYDKDADKFYMKADADSGGAPEGTAVLSTGEDNTKYLRADGDNSSSWQTPAGGGDLLADGTVPLTADWDVGNFNVTAHDYTGDGTIEGAVLTEGGQAVWNASETDILDSEHYIADSIDNEHINWADIDNLGNEGAVTLAATTTALATARTIGGTNFDGTANIVPATATLGTTFRKSFVITSPTATADGAVWRVPAACTITAVHGVQVGGTNVVGHLDECDANGLNGAGVDGATDMTILTTNVDDDGSLSNPSIDSGDYIGWHTTSVSGTITRVTISFEGTWD